MPSCGTIPELPHVAKCSKSAEPMRACMRHAPLQYHRKREKVTVERLRVGDLVDLGEDGCFGALTAPELVALRQVWPDHPVIRATLDERQNSPGVATTTGVKMTLTVGGISRRVVGWSMRAAMTAQLVTDALVMAIWRRGKPDALLHHSDRGSQFTSGQFQKLMADHGAAS